MAFVSSLTNFRGLIACALLFAILYYGWPIIEQILLMLPIPDPKASIEQVKSFASSGMDMVSGAISSPTRRDAQPSGYSGNLESAPEAYLQGDEDSESDEEAKGISGTDDKIKLSYDSDEKNDDETVPISEPGSSELIDLGGSSGNDASTGKKKSIPKLAGPGK
jgi:hypothetical protein